MWYISFFDLARSTYQWFQLRNGAGSCRDCSVSRRWCVPVQQQRCHQRRRLGTLLSCFGWGTPKKWIGKWRGLKFNMKKTQNGDTPSWVQHQIITIFRAQKMHGLIVTITNLVDELVPFFLTHTQLESWKTYIPWSNLGWPDSYIPCHFYHIYQVNPNWKTYIPCPSMVFWFFSNQPVLLPSCLAAGGHQQLGWAAFVQWGHVLAKSLEGHQRFVPLSADIWQWLT